MMDAYFHANDFDQVFKTMFPEKKINILYSNRCLCVGESTIGNHSGFRKHLQGFSFSQGKMSCKYASLQEAGKADVFQP